MIRSLLPVFCFFLLFGQITAARAQQVFKTTSKSVIGYLEYLPDGYHSNNNDYPVVIFLHGTGERGPSSNDPRVLATGRALLEKIGPPNYVKKGTKFPFILISPQLKKSYSAWPTAYVMEVIDKVLQELRIDRRRIYITGLSMGGFGTWAMIEQYPKLFAAAAPLCGGGNTRNAKAIADENLPVWAFHGDADNVVNVSRSIQMVNAINSYNPNPRAKLSIYNGVKHDAWTRAYRTDHAYHNPNVYEWMMAQRKGSAPAPANELPVADAGPDRTIRELDGRVVINGSGRDKDGSIKSYAWSKVSGGAVDMQGTNTKDLSISGYTKGAYVFKLTVTDDKGATGSDEVKVTVEQSYAPPVANAGPDVTVQLPQNEVTLKGTATAKDGVINNIRWEKLEGGEVEMSGMSSLELKLENLRAGDYKFRLTVKTDKGLSHSDEVTVTVKPPSNDPPVVNAGADVVAKASDKEVVIKGSDKDEDGSISKYEWKKVSGGDLVLENANTSEVTVSGFAEGTYVLRLTVTDNKGATAYDEVKLTVQAPEYKAPVANAGPDQEIELPHNSIVLKGSGKSEDGKIIAYEWKQTSGDAVEMSGASTPELTVRKLNVGEYKFRLTVKTDKGLSHSDEVTVTVKPASNALPVVNAGADVVAEASDEEVVIKGSAKDEDGSISKYEWKKVSGGDLVLENANTSEVTVSGFAEGTYVLRLTVTDNKGATAYDEVKLTVHAPEYKAPVASAGPDQEIELPQNSIVLKGSGKSEDGKIIAYEWKQTSGDAVEMSGASTPELTVRKLNVGEYKFRLTVKSDKGLSGSDEVLVTVKRASNIPPVADAGPDKTIKESDERETISGKGKDEDGTIKSYEWTKVSGGAVDMANANTPELTISAFTEGTYVFRLTVTDDKGAKGSDDVKVTVEAPDWQAPIANAGLDLEVTLPADFVTIKGSARAIHGKITSYKWTKKSGAEVELEDENTPTLTVRNLRKGYYVFQLAVETDKGTSDTDDVVLRVVEPANIKPVANAGDDLTIIASEEQLVIKGSGSDKDGKITGYSWAKVSGGKVTMTDSDKAALTISEFEAGTYVFSLTVTDDNGARASDEVKVTVEPAVQRTPNKAPVADAGEDRTISDDVESFVLIGFGKDEDGEVVSYEWKQVSGETTVAIADANKSAATVSDFSIGKYVFRLTVTDNEGAKSSDEITVTVEGADKPRVFAGNDRTIVLPENSIELHGGASVEKGIITGYRWTKRSGGAATLSGENTKILVASDLEVGVYVFRLTATADNGQTGYDDIQITVRRAANTAPVADAGPDHTIDEDSGPFTLVGSGKDKESSDLTYGWRKVSGGSVTLANQDTPSLTISDFKAGKYVFRLTVTDEQGAKGSDDVTVVVNEVASEPESRPVAYAGNDRIIRLPINSISLRGGAKAEGRTIVKYEWEMIEGGHAKLSGMDTQTMIASELEIGKYTFRLKATCDLGFSAYDDVTVTVKESLFPIANVERGNSDINSRSPEEPMGLGGLDHLPTSDLTLGAVPQLENYDVAVYNDRGDKIFHGTWEADSFEQVFTHPGFYVYHVLDGKKRIKIGKLIIQP